MTSLQTPADPTPRRLCAGRAWLSAALLWAIVMPHTVAATTAAPAATPPSGATATAAAAAKPTSTAAPAATAGCPPLLQHTLPRLQDEKPIDLCTHAGKVVMVVNTASLCGYTGQYRSLEALNESHGSRGLVVLGFPSNDFGNQEPGANEDISEFCENTFGVKFPMFAKSHVRAGTAVNPLHAALAERTGQTPRWNFHKYLISRDGSEVISVDSRIDPQSPDVVRAIERLLSTR
jgi:glutathione peroxidase